MLNPRGIEARVSSIILYIWPLLFGLPQMLSGEATRRVLVVGVLIAIIAMAVFARRLATQHTWPNSTRSVFLGSILIALLLMNMLSIFRAPPDLISVDTRPGLAISLLAFAVLTFFSYEDMENTELIEQRFFAFCLSIPIFIAVNMVLVLRFGQDRLLPPDDLSARTFSYSDTLGLLGISVRRLSAIPAMYGSNTIGIVAGIGVLIAYILFFVEIKQSRRVKVLLFTFTLIIINGFAILLADSRAMLLWVAFGILVYHFSTVRTLGKIGHLMTAFSSVSAYVVGMLFKSVASGPLARLAQRDISSGPDLGVGTGRPYIWDAAYNRLSSFEVTQLYGYGHFGHFTAGIGNKLLWIFNRDPARVHLHNATLQNVFNIGYVGAGLFIVGTWICIDATARSHILPDWLRRLLLILFIIYLGNGYTESIGTIYQIIPFLFLIGMMSLCWSVCRYDGLRLLWADTTRSDTSYENAATDFDVVVTPAS